MKKASEWFLEYGQSHQNATNKLIHWICVPAIFWSVALILWSVPLPAFMQISPYLNWATVAMLMAMVFYLTASLSIAAGMLLFSIGILGLTSWVASSFSLPTWQLGLGIFVAAWILQFVGHKIEGKKPSFFDDLLYLFVGPAWLLGFIYSKLGIKYA